MKKTNNFVVNLLWPLLPEGLETDSSGVFKEFAIRTSVEQRHFWGTGVHLEFEALTPTFTFHFSFICPHGLEDTVPDLHVGVWIKIRLHGKL